MPSPPRDRILSTTAELATWRDELDAQGKKLVFTSGCFDLVHPGHTRYLQQARDLGDALVIALNSDASVRELKGPSRPINDQTDRAEVLRALRSVDAVVVFDEQRTTRLIEAIQPHIFSKGGDYTEESINPEELAALRSVGAAIRILPIVDGKSTTNTLKRMSVADGPPNRPLRLGILGSGEGSTLQSVIDAIIAGPLHAEIACAITDQPDSAFLKRAKAAGIASRAVHPGVDTRRFPEFAQKEVCEHLQRAGVDLVLLTGFMRLVKEPLLSAFADRMWNLHPSLLPAFKGSDAIQQALDAGVPETGSTLHEVTADLDGGPILDQTRVPILPDDTLTTLTTRVKQAEQTMLLKALTQKTTAAS